MKRFVIQFLSCWSLLSNKILQNCPETISAMNFASWLTCAYRYVFLISRKIGRLSLKILFFSARSNTKSITRIFTQCWFRRALSRIRLRRNDCWLCPTISPTVIKHGLRTIWSSEKPFSLFTPSQGHYWIPPNSFFIPMRDISSSILKLFLHVSHSVLPPLCTAISITIKSTFNCALQYSQS